MPVTRNYPLEVSEFNSTVKCNSCEIFIGIGHNDAIPFSSSEEAGCICRSCHEAELRRARAGWRAVVWAE